MSKSKKTKPIAQQRIQPPIANDEGAKCPHCGERYGHKAVRAFPNGRRQMLCGGCGRSFVELL